MPSLALPINKPSHHNAPSAGNSFASPQATPFGYSPQSFGNSFSGHAWLRDAIPSVTSYPEQHRPSDDFSTMYPNRLEEAFCRNFNCCGKNLDDLHQLIHHYEEQHAVLPSDVNLSSSLDNSNSASVANHLNRNNIQALKQRERIRMHDLADQMDSSPLYDNSAVMPFAFPANEGTNGPYRVSVVVPAAAAAAATAANPDLAEETSMQNEPVSTPTFLPESMVMDDASSPLSDMSFNMDIGSGNRYNMFGVNQKNDPESAFLPPFHYGHDVFSFHPDTRPDTPNTVHSEPFPDNVMSPTPPEVVAPAATNTAPSSPFIKNSSKDFEWPVPLKKQRSISPESSESPMTIDSPGSSLVVVDKPYKCPVPNCDKAYKNQNGLKYHKLHGHCSPITTPTPTPVPHQGFVVENKPYRCDTCNKRYKNLNGLKYHRAHSHLQVSMAQAQREVQMSFMRDA
ncbi:DNA-binding transcription factor Sfp1 [Schizosaccharomyces osmophilus]|uniref:DNA-binding transcription factor Sfp1 n=1 Tax=Schizosaccharomyces osmophilus TaxID=2545709 RepID=A0AAF0AXK2_9SCHI|nr:DNA-binding transcription factor Sfp1 [Schizosaccharomyces osmophilus]WBW73909.1 DNA-binding transcription factor Sfp1 [Schizosaccharomyces osmophilus]